jgi:hypothetical protein
LTDEEWNKCIGVEKNEVITVYNNWAKQVGLHWSDKIDENGNHIDNDL